MFSSSAPCFGANHAGDALQVLVDDAHGVSERGHPLLVEPERPVAEVPDEVELMGHDQERDPPELHLLDLRDALLRELLVADGEDFVDQENVGIDVDGDREPEADVHARGVGLDRLVEVRADVRELDDPVEALVDLAAREAEHDPVDVDVLAPADLGVKARSQLDERRDPSVHQTRSRVVGLRIPEMSLSSVDFPDPFRPMTPNASPRPTSKVMSRRASTEASARGARSRPRSALLSVWSWELRPKSR